MAWCRQASHFTSQYWFNCCHRASLGRNVLKNATWLTNRWNYVYVTRGSKWIILFLNVFPELKLLYFDLHFTDVFSYESDWILVRVTAITCDKLLRYYMASPEVDELIISEPAMTPTVNTMPSSNPMGMVFEKFNTLRLRQNDHHLPNNTFKCIFLN